MPKAWGLQYVERMEKFARAFAGTRASVTEEQRHVRQAERSLNTAQSELRDSEARHSANERALRSLMDMGPGGLARIEGESGPALDIGPFLVKLDEPQNRGVESTNFCTRAPGHDGPCNGYLRGDCHPKLKEEAK